MLLEASDERTMASVVRFLQRYQRLVVSQCHPRPLIQLHYVKLVLPRDPRLVRHHRVIVDGSRGVSHRFAQARRVFLVYDGIREALCVPDAVTSTEHLSGIVSVKLKSIRRYRVLLRFVSRFEDWKIFSVIWKLKYFRNDHCSNDN